MESGPFVYVSISDRDLASFPDFWPVVARSGNIQTLRRIRHHSGNPEWFPLRRSEKSELNRYPSSTVGQGLATSAEYTVLLIDLRSEPRGKKAADPRSFSGAFRSGYGMRGSGTDKAGLRALSTRVSQPTAKTTLLHSSGRGQASLIRVLGQKTGNSSDFLHSLGSPIKRPKLFRKIVDHIFVRRRVVLSLDHWPIINPADRIRRAKSG